MRKILSILLLIVPFLLMGQGNNQEAIREIDRAIGKISSMQCDFVQTKHIRMLNNDMVSEGQMNYKSNKLRWEYKRPYQFLFLVNGSNVTMLRNGRREQINTNQNKVFREIVNIMMSSVVGKCLSDTKNYRTSIAEHGSAWLATIVPLRKELKQLFTKFVITFDKNIGAVTQVVLYEKNGDCTTIKLRNIKLNTPIADDTFMAK